MELYYIYLEQEDWESFSKDIATSSNSDPACRTQSLVYLCQKLDQSTCLHINRNYINLNEAFQVDLKA